MLAVLDILQDQEHLSLLHILILVDLKKEGEMTVKKDSLVLVKIGQICCGSLVRYLWLLPAQVFLRVCRSYRCHRKRGAV